MQNTGGDVRNPGARVIYGEYREQKPIDKPVSVELPL